MSSASLATVQIRAVSGSELCQGLLHHPLLLPSETASFLSPIWKLEPVMVVVPICLLPFIINCLRTGINIFITSAEPKRVWCTHINSSENVCREQPVAKDTITSGPQLLPFTQLFSKGCIGWPLRDTRRVSAGCVINIKASSGPCRHGLVNGITGLWGHILKPHHLLNFRAKIFPGICHFTVRILSQLFNPLPLFYKKSNLYTPNVI